MCVPERLKPLRRLDSFTSETKLGTDPENILIPNNEDESPSFVGVEV